MESMEPWERMAKTMFNTRLERGSTHGQARKMAQEIISDFEKQAREFNRISPASGPEQLPRMAVFRTVNPVKQLLAHRKAAEADLKALHTKLLAFEKRMLQSRSPKQVEEAVKQIKAHHEYLQQVLETIEFRNYQALDPLPGRDKDAYEVIQDHYFRRDWKTMAKNAAIDLVNENMLMDVTGFGKYTRRMMGRDLHPMWYIGERRDQYPDEVSDAEMLRVYVTGEGKVHPKDLEPMQKIWIAHRCVDLIHMAAMYKSIHESLSDKLKKMKG